MPREKIEIPGQIDHLSILDKDGNLDKDLEPALPDDLLLKLYRTMVLGREFDARQLSLQRQGRIGTFPPITGQEAAHLGPAAVLRDSDWLVPSFRETVAELWRGRTIESILLANNGYNEGAEMKPGMNMMPISVPVGSQVIHAVGIAWAMKYRGTDDLAMVFFGDGATSEGDFHEGINMAGVYDAPVIFVCQNNHWAISIPRSKQTRSKTIAQKAIAYGIAGIQVDGNDILATYAAAREAAERARSGGGPTLIECVTYRLRMHTTADDPKRYRTDEEVQGWEKQDPLLRYQKYLKAKGLLSDEEIVSISDAIKADIADAVKRAEERMKEIGDPGDAMSMFNHAYAEMHPYLKEQKDRLAAELKETAKEGDNG